MAAPEFTLFVKPYLEGWDNGEEGNTPITAEILNGNYDAFLLALNDWATSVGLILEEAVTDSNYVHTDNNYTSTEKDKLSGIEANANNYSLPTASTSTLGGVKVDGITITISNGVISAQGGGTDVEGNPSGTPTAVLSSIRIGSTVYSIPGGGGGGSSVSFTQVLSTGTKIGTITIDGVPTDIYAPTPPTKTSDLTNDSNFVADANYVHTDNNYTTTEKNKLSGLVAVEANPSGSASTDLTKIAIGGTNYNIPSGGGGGTTVVANPSGAATAGNLNKLQVGNDIYSIPSGGGSQEITPISNVDYSNLTPQQKSNGQVYLVSPVTSFSPDYTASNWSLYSQIESSYCAEINNGQLAFVTPAGGGDYNSYARATYKVGVDLTDVESIVVNTTITYIGSPREIQIGLTDTLPGNYSMPTLNPNESLETSSSWTLPISKTIELDTSELTGTYYFTIKANGKTCFTVDSIAFNVDDGDIPNEIYHMNKKFSQYPNGGSGGSGHTILNDSGTALTQEDNLQFKGAYVHDDSTNEKTVVEVTRTMTLAQYQALSAAEKKGVIAVTDDSPAPYFTDVVGTLAAGATSITLSDVSITLNSTIDLFTDTYGVNPSAISVADGSITLTFAAQQAAVNVKVRVS